MAQLAAISKVPLVTTSLPPKRASSGNERGDSGHHQHRKRQAEIDLRQGPSLSAAIARQRCRAYKRSPVDELLTARGEGKASGIAFISMVFIPLRQLS